MERCFLPFFRTFFLEAYVHAFDRLDSGYSGISTFWMEESIIVEVISILISAYLLAFMLFHQQECFKAWLIVKVVRNYVALCSRPLGTLNLRAFCECIGSFFTCSFKDGAVDGLVSTRTLDQKKVKKNFAKDIIIK